MDYKNSKYHSKHFLDKNTIFTIGITPPSDKFNNWKLIFGPLLRSGYFSKALQLLITHCSFYQKWLYGDNHSFVSGAVNLWVISVPTFLFLLTPMTTAVDSNCDYYQSLVMGQTYYIYNHDYPNSYNGPLNCLWVAETDKSSKIIISCDIDLPSVREMLHYETHYLYFEPNNKKNSYPSVKMTLMFLWSIHFCMPSNHLSIS